MRYLRVIFCLSLLCGFLVSISGANAKSAPKASPKASATPDPKKDPQIQKILSDLRPLYPHLTTGEVVRTSNHDLRRMYEHLYHAEGMNLLEAKKKASVVLLKEN